MQPRTVFGLSGKNSMLPAGIYATIDRSAPAPKGVFVKSLFRPRALAVSVSASLAVLRVVVGASLMHHGQGKMENAFGWMGTDSAFPGILQALAALSEFGGGLALILGLLTPLASFGIACTMAVATGMHLFVMKDPFVSASGGSSYEHALSFFAVALVCLVAGPGSFSADARIFGERPAL